MKKILSLLFLSLLITISPISTKADTTLSKDTVGNPELTYEVYLELIDSGILDETITYDVWVQLNSEERSNSIKEEAELSSLPTTLSGSTSSLVRGDILISNGSSSYGLTGHAGIVVGNDRILHIAGPGYKTNIIKFSTWTNKYGKPRGGIVNTEVYRISNWTHRNAAADWAVAKYENLGASYSLTTGLYTFNPTYCSKIVWQAYHYGPSTSLVNAPGGPLATPYGLPTYFKSTANISYQFNF
ncbi:MULTISPECIES: hypothetical protein [unclassified Sporosarcina]|uniref:hypothetical protein n=1 Tax=unclassified Sporosarcina TaxID=2647733 RepID=UPI0030FC0E43